MDSTYWMTGYWITGISVCAAAALAVCSPVAVTAQDNGPTLYAVECSFSHSAAANIMPGGSVQMDLSTTDRMAFSFVWSPETGEATMSGNLGAVRVVPIVGENRLTFLEVTDNGTVQTTALYGLTIGEVAAVHSRASGGEGYELPSQWYGYCNMM